MENNFDENNKKDIDPNNEIALKKITFMDKVRSKIKYILGYREGKRFIEDTEPFLKSYSDIELAVISNIEERLKDILTKNSIEGKLVDGLKKEDALKIIEWVVQRDRAILGKECDIKNSSLLGYCGLSQGIVSTLLTNMGLSPRISNMNPTITGEHLGGHAFNSVAIPIKEENGHICEINFLIDATYRQFFLRDKITVASGTFVKDKRFGNKVAPLAGYWCINLPGGKEFAKNILKNGYVELTPENAKIYGDSFILEIEKDKEYKDKYKKGITVPQSTTRSVNTGISGEEYISRLIDEKRQDHRGIDYDNGELEGHYPGLLNTPLMVRKGYNRTNNAKVPEYNKGEKIDKENERDN